jgi:hypothetical protein
MLYVFSVSLFYGEFSTNFGRARTADHVPTIDILCSMAGFSEYSACCQVYIRECIPVTLNANLWYLAQSKHCSPEFRSPWHQGFTLS